MRVSSFLAQFATVENGKVTVVSGAIDLLPPISVYYIVSLIYVAASEAGQHQVVRYELHDSSAGLVQNPKTGAPTVVTQPLFVVWPGDVSENRVLQVPRAVLAPPFMLVPGDYTWQITIDGAGSAEWNAPFTVRSA